MANGNARDKSKVLRDIPAACADEDAAVEFFETQRWGDSPICPRCESSDVYQMRRRGSEEREKDCRWRCRGCGKQYTVRTGTVLEDSKIPLRHWCYAFWAACSSKKGVSALQIKRMTGLSYKSALFLMHRIRWAMADEAPEPLSGTLEIDEAYVGGKPRRANRARNANVKSGRGTSKAPVVAMVQRGGEVRAAHVPSVNAANLKGFIYANAECSSRVLTDELPPYRYIRGESMALFTRSQRSTCIAMCRNSSSGTTLARWTTVIELRVPSGNPRGRDCGIDNHESPTRPRMRSRCPELG
jgi:transposase-like protein